MRNARRGFIGAVLFCVLLAMGLATANPPAAITASVSLKCTEITSGDIIVMRVRYETRITAKAFAVSFDAEPQFGTGRLLTVLVAGVPVGELKSQRIVGGYVGGEMTFTEPVEPFTHSKAFPDDFPPEVAPDTAVSLAAGGKILVSCRLE
jgi:hypothetical protein